jgi:hypothetical protein
VFSILDPRFPGWGPTVPGDSPTGQAYFTEDWWVVEAARFDPRQVVGSDHRMVPTYLNALVRAGLTLEEATEADLPPPWRPPGAEPVSKFFAAGHRKPD